jgi:hypothetical protein
MRRWLWSQLECGCDNSTESSAGSRRPTGAHPRAASLPREVTDEPSRVGERLRGLDEERSGPVGEAPPATMRLSPRTSNGSLDRDSCSATNAAQSGTSHDDPRATATDDTQPSDVTLPSLLQIAQSDSAAAGRQLEPSTSGPRSGSSASVARRAGCSANTAASSFLATDRSPCATANKASPILTPAASGRAARRSSRMRRARAGSRRRCGRGRSIHSDADG